MNMNMSTDTFLYRYVTVRYAPYVDEFDNPVGSGRVVVELNYYRVTKYTKCGAWIMVDGSKKFVNLNAKKKFALPSKLLAADSFIARKKAQVRILKHKIDEAEKSLKLIYNEIGSGYNHLTCNLTTIEHEKNSWLRNLRS